MKRTVVQRKLHERLIKKAEEKAAVAPKRTCGFCTRVRRTFARIMGHSK